MLDKLERALEEGPIEIKKPKELFSRIYITKYALEKARAYATLAKDRNGSPTECYGFLLGSSHTRSRIIHDVYFAPGQEAGAAHVRIAESRVIESGREIRAKMLDKRVVGWWHSHANFGTFHSGTDAENFKTVLNQVSPTNYLNVYEDQEFLNSRIKKTIIGGSTISICDRDNNSKRLELIFADELEANPLIGKSVDRLKIRMPCKVGYAFSVVVNALGAYPHTELATKKLCPVCMDSHYESRVIPLKIIDCGEYQINSEELKEEVHEKLILPPPVIYVPWKRFSVPTLQDQNIPPTASDGNEKSGGGGKKKRRIFIRWRK